LLIGHGNSRPGSHPQWHFYGVSCIIFAQVSITALRIIVQKQCSYLVFLSSKMLKRVEATKLLTDEMHEESMQDRWIVDEEWVPCTRNLHCNQQVGIHDMNVGSSKTCAWCNDRCLLDNCTLLHNVKSIKVGAGLKKVPKTRFTVCCHR
jgi:hypothetical protein